MKQAIRILLMVGLALGAVVVVIAAPAPELFVITPDRVAAAISKSGIPAAAGEIKLPATVVARVADPVLKVKSIDRSDSEHAVARLECAVAGQCLPFIVTIHLSAGANTTLPPAPSAAVSSSQPALPSVRTGTIATLLLEGAHVHISMPVICLENGAVGQRIRVTGKDRAKVYLVSVVREGVVEGKL